MDNLSFKNSFIRTIGFTFKTTLKSIKLYIFMLLIPVSFYVFSYLFISNFDSKIINPAIMLSKLLLPSIFSIMVITTLMNDWNKSIFIKYVNIFKLKKFHLMLAVFIVFFFLNLAFLLLFISITSFIDIFLVNKSMINALNLKTYYILIDQKNVNFLINFRRIVGVIFVFIFSSLINFLIGYMMSHISKNLILVQILNIFLISFILIFSDMFIDPNDSLFNNNVIYICYLVPQKYLTWLVYLFYADIGTDKSFINLIILNLRTKLFVDNYVLPILVLFAYTMLLLFLIPGNRKFLIERVKKWKIS